MTLEEILQSPFMEHAVVEEAAQGLSHEVTWCVPSSSLEFGNYIMPGLLLVDTGEAGLWSNERFTRLLADGTIAGVVVFSDEPCQCSDRCAALERAGVPLLRLPKGTGAVEFMRRFVAILSIHELARYELEDWLRSLCFGAGLAGNDDAVAQFGYNRAYSYYCLRLVPRGSAEGADAVAREMAALALKGRLEEALPCDDVPVLALLNHGDEVIAFVPWPSSAPGSALRHRIDAFAEDGLGQTGSIAWTCAVGDRANSVLELRDSYKNARDTAEIVHLLHVTDRVCYYADWYMHMLLLRESRDTLQRSMERSLAPLLDEPDLLETLASYLVFGESLKVTSEHMGIHVNTLKYRLKRISGLLDTDLHDPNARFRLRMAVTIERYLRG